MIRVYTVVYFIHVIDGISIRTSNKCSRWLLGRDTGMNRTDTDFFPAHIVALVAISLIIGGCPSSKKSTDRAPSPPSLDPIVIVAIDRSGSTEVHRESQRLAAEAATAFSADNHNLLGFYAVDRKAVSIQEPKSFDIGGLSDSVKAEFETKPSSRSVGTRPLAFWQEINERYQTTKAPVYVAFLTDGGNDYAADKKAVTSTLKQLSSNPNIHVAILGVNSDLSTDIRRDLSPFGNRGIHSVQNGKASNAALRAELMTFLGGIQ